MPDTSRSILNLLPGVLSQDGDLHYRSSVRCSQTANPSKTGKLSQFSFDFTGDFNRNTGAISKAEKLQDLWGSHVHLYPSDEKHILPTDG